MPDYEVLELILFNALPRIDTKPVAKTLLARFGSIGGILAASRTDLKSVPGVGDAAVVALKIARELGHRAAREELANRSLIHSWDKVLDYCRGRLAHEATERFHVLFLDSRHALIADEEMQHGTVDHAPVYPREIIRRALELGATALILLHNHPSGDPDPSNDDIEITKSIMAAAAAMDIRVLDHLIVGRDGHASLRTLGLM